MSRQAKKVADQTNQQRQQILGDVSGYAKDISGLAGGIPADLTPEQKAAYLRSKLGSIPVGYETAQERATREMGRTGSTAGLAELTKEMQFDKSRALSQAGGSAQLELADIPIQRANEKAALFGQAGGLEGGLYAPTAGLQGKALEIAAQPGLFGQMLLNAAKGAGGAATAGA